MERTFDADSRTPARARRFAKETLRDLLRPGEPRQSLVDDVELVVSELVTNAVRAGSPTVELSLALDGTDGRRLVLRVSDEAVGWPQARDAAIDDPGGRGLPLVSALSASWGVRLLATGKVVWAELPVPAA